MKTNEVVEVVRMNAGNVDGIVSRMRALLKGKEVYLALIQPEEMERYIPSIASAKVVDVVAYQEGGDVILLEISFSTGELTFNIFCGTDAIPNPVARFGESALEIHDHTTMPMLRHVLVIKH